MYINTWSIGNKSPGFNSDKYGAYNYTWLTSSATAVMTHLANHISDDLNLVSSYDTLKIFGSLNFKLYSEHWIALG